MNKNKKVLVRILASAALFAAAIVCFRLWPQPWYWQLAAYLLIYLLIGYDIVLEALGGIGRGQLFDENFLMVLATVGAFGTKQYPEAVTVMLLYQVGELFQRYAVGKSRGSIRDLMDLRPDCANVLRDGAVCTVLPEEVRLGETFLVRPGERVPLDGTVLSGESAVDTSALTGETVPRFCKEGDSILSGMIVSSGALEIRAEKTYYDSTVAKILDMVENAAGKKAKTEKFITKFARYYTPVVVVAALLLAVVPPLFDGYWNGWISKAMNFLVVSCPCALVISVPMSFFAGIGAASRLGVLVKGGNYLDLMSKADTFVFDKTGTLTHGRFVVTNVVPAARADEILQAAAIAEHRSLHPIGQSVLEAAGTPTETGWHIEELAGHGVQAVKEQQIILAGNYRFMKAHGLEVSRINSAGTVVYVAKNGEFLGHIEIADTVKADAAETVKSLKAQGANVIILTGDRYDVASDVAKQVGADGFEAELLPGDKVACVEELLGAKQKKSVLAFVGDGINDAPVLMRADVGIAMGAIGSDAAIEAADIVLMHDRLSAIGEAKKVARKTMAIVMQNIVFALSVKLLVLALTPFGFVSIWLAIFADVGVAVLAILNAMRAGNV